MNFQFGVDNAGDVFIQKKQNTPRDLFLNPLWMSSVKDIGFDFVVYHYVPDPSNTLSQHADNLSSLSAAFTSNKLDYLLNLEIANRSGVTNLIDKDGWDWVNQPDGRHFFRFPTGFMRSAGGSSSFLGVVYDEPEHMQIHRYWDKNKQDSPVFADTTGLSLQQAEEAVYNTMSTLVQAHKSDGARYIASEHVFPALFHNFARAGMTLTPKLLKESWAPLFTATAMGAALQYSTELWAVADLWNSGQYPGHSPEELRSVLIFSYWMGFNRTYIENLNYNGSLYTVEQDGNGNQAIRLSPYGEVANWFANQYIPEHPRKHTFKDVKPEIAIIRFDDTDIGQGEIGPKDFWRWRGWLYGSKSQFSTSTTSNWMKIWNLLTHGQVPEKSLTWHFGSQSAYKHIPHRSFVPLNNTVVFDDKVRKKHMSTLKLAFLNGTQISEGTMEDIMDLVRSRGLNVITTPELAPDFVKATYKQGTMVVKDGSAGGMWVVTDNVLDNQVKQLVMPYLGKPDEIRYVFGEKEKEIVLTLLNGNEIEPEPLRP